MGGDKPIPQIIRIIPVDDLAAFQRVNGLDKSPQVTIIYARQRIQIHESRLEISLQRGELSSISLIVEIPERSCEILFRQHCLDMIPPTLDGMWGKVRKVVYIRQTSVNGTGKHLPLLSIIADQDGISRFQEIGIEFNGLIQMPDLGIPMESGDGQCVLPQNPWIILNQR